jgi:hypothetical protein
MDQPAKPLTSDGGDTRRWIGRLIIAVLLGEAIWGLIVSFMNHVFVPWLGDIMGPSSGLPTSFTQRPYNYPELFVSVFEFCIAGLVAAIINFFLQRSSARRGKTVKTISPPGPVRVISQAAPPPAPPVIAPPPFEITPAVSPEPAPVQDVRMYPVIPSILVPAASAEPSAPVPPAPQPAVVAPVAPATVPAAPKPVAAKPAPPAPKAEPAKPQKPKNVYYNIVGEPMPSDED